MMDIITPHQQARKDAEVAEQTARGTKQKKARWQYNSREYFELNSPSKYDGLDEKKERKWRREYMLVIQKAGMALKIPQWGIATAALLCHRFFALRSMKKNDRVVIAAACLHLAAKMEENPRPVRDVVREAAKVRYSKNPDLLRKATEADEVERAKDELLQGERTVLYTLGFDIHTQHPYSFLVAEATKLDLLTESTREGSPYKAVMQNTWNFVNDSFRTTLCLQFKPEKLAWAALWLANEMNKAHHATLSGTASGLAAATKALGAMQAAGSGGSSAGLEQMAAEQDAAMRAQAWPAGGIEPLLFKQQPGATFFEYFKVGKHEVIAIANQMLELYEESKLSAQEQQQSLMHPQQR